MKLSGHTIFVTGGAGFIGGHFVEKIARANRVIVYDNFTSSVLTADFLRRLPNVRVIRGDILNPRALNRAMHGADIVFHFAAAHVRLSLTQPLFVHEVNATGALNVFLAARKNGVKRVIHISSSEAYGSAKKPKIKEDHPMDPTTVYGASKYMGELYAKYFNDHEGVPTIIIRPFNTYGPRAHFNGVYGEVIPRFTVLGLLGKQPVIFGSGRQTRDFTYVTDTVAGIMRAAASETLFGRPVNIAYGAEVRVNDIAKIITHTLGLPFHPTYKATRPNDVMRHFADITKAQKILSYAPAVDIRTGIGLYIDWIQERYPDVTKLAREIPDINW